MALQPKLRACVRELAGAGRGRRQGPAGLARGPRSLPLHLRPVVPPARGDPPAHRARGPPLRAHLVREGLGAQVLEERRHGLPLLARGVAGAAELTVTRYSFGNRVMMTDFDVLTLFYSVFLNCYLFACLRYLLFMQVSKYAIVTYERSNQNVS